MLIIIVRFLKLFSLSESLPNFKNQGGSQKSFCLYGLHLSILIILGTKMYASAAATALHDGLIGLLYCMFFQHKLANNFGSVDP